MVLKLRIFGLHFFIFGNATSKKRKVTFFGFSETLKNVFSNYDDDDDVTDAVYRRERDARNTTNDGARDNTRQY